MNITLDYPVRPVPRWGHGKPPHAGLHAIINQGREHYQSRLRQLRDLAPFLTAIPVEPLAEKPEQPAWNNPWFSGLDLAALYAVVALDRPRRYLEIGSGWTTKVVRRAATEHDVPLHITSIDPFPRAEIDRLCDEVVRVPVEEVDQSVFSTLQSGDVLFVDSSHRIFTNSDCVVMILEILPALAPGVIVHFHDIFLPYDYPPEWNERYYSEQYLLAAWLLAGGRTVTVELPNMFISNDESLAAELVSLWTGPLAGVQRHGGSLWLRRTDPADH
jgi:hypothetical protein